MDSKGQSPLETQKRWRVLTWCLSFSYFFSSLQRSTTANTVLGAKYLGFFSSCSLKTREKYISFVQLVLLSLYIFCRKVKKLRGCRIFSFMRNILWTRFLTDPCVCFAAVYVAVPKKSTEYQYCKHIEVSLPVWLIK